MIKNKNVYRIPWLGGKLRGGLEMFIIVHIHTTNM